MKEDILKAIFKARQETSLDEISIEELSKSIEKIEAELGNELSGYVTADQPQKRFWQSAEIPEKRFSKYLLEACDKNPNKICLEAGKERLTYAQLKELIVKYADALKKHGIKEGDIIVVQSLSTPSVIGLVMAANLIGAITRPIDPLSKPERTVSFINDSEVNKTKLLVLLDINALKFKKKVMEQTTIENIVTIPVNDNITDAPIIIRTLFRTLSELTKTITNRDKRKYIRPIDEYMVIGNPKSEIEHLEAEYHPNETVAIYSTSGSSSKIPKGVEITNENLVSSIAKQLDANYDITTDDTIYNPMPTHSSYFWDDILLAGIYGCKTKLSPLFDVENCAKMIISSGCSIILAGPIIIKELCDYITENEKKGIFIDLNHIKHVISGGDVLDVELEKKANKILKQHKSTAKICNAYGTSEKIGPANVPNGVSKTQDTYTVGSVGTPLPGDTVGVFQYDKDTDNRSIDAPGYEKGLKYFEIGEICFDASDPDVFKKYYRMEAATEAVKIKHKDGRTWYHSGDLGFITPGGQMFCVGRKSGLIVRSGHKVLASSIESTVKQIDGIKDCAVIGVPDSKEKEIPILFVVFKNELTVIEKNKILNGLSLYLRKMIDQMHVPGAIIQLETIPRNLMQKAIIPELMDAYIEEKEKAEVKKTTVKSFLHNVSLVKTKLRQDK